MCQKFVPEGALESQRTKGTAEELLRLYLMDKELYYTPAEKLLRLRGKTCSSATNMNLTKL
jgi:hypothetical protein